MLDSWSTLRGMIYSIRHDVYTLSPPKASYTIGRAAGADFVADTPVRVTAANIVLSTGGTKAYTPIQILDADEWSAVTVRDYTTTFPTAIYIDYTSPNVTIWCLGIPSGSPGLELWAWKKATLFVSEADPVIAPEGYLEAAVYNLAVRLGEMFGTAQAMSPTIFDNARRALARVKALNQPSPTITTIDGGMPSESGGSFNWMIGGPA
jgi:hypothetical protein